jgi:hypothetical protein
MDSEIETQIHECEARLYTAMATSDVSELDMLIADDLLFVGPTGELATKAMDLEVHRSFSMGMSRTEVRLIYEAERE